MPPQSPPPPLPTTTNRLNHRHQPSTTSTTSSTSSSSSSTRPALQHILTNSPSNAVHLSRSTARTSRRVRSHWFSHFAFNWRRSSRTSKLFLASSMTLMAVQVIASIIVLTFSWEMYCDKPLRIFITVYILRLALACPLTVYLHLIPRRLLQQQRQQQQQQRQTQQQLPISQLHQQNNNPSSYHQHHYPTMNTENRVEQGEMYPMSNIINIPNNNISSSSSSSHGVTTTGIVPSAAQPPLPPTTPASFISSAHQEQQQASHHFHSYPSTYYYNYHNQHHSTSSYHSSYPQQQPSMMAQAPPPNIMHRTSRPEISNPFYPDNTLTHWIDRAKSALDMFGLLWFIIGNYMLFTSSTCSETAVPLYYLSLVVIVYNYLIISVPIFLCTAVIFCLPCVLVGMRIIHVEDAVDMGGASTEEIGNIPVYQFKSNKPTYIPPPPHNTTTHEVIEIHELPSSNNATTTTTTNPTTSTTTPTTLPTTMTTTTTTTTTKNKSKKMESSMEPSLSFLDHIWVRLGFISDSSLNELSSSSSYQEFDTIEIPNEQDQVCAICLSTYDDGDILCQLWCNHHFHRTCVHEWLVLNSRCPMCKRDCRGKPYPEENSS